MTREELEAIEERHEAAEKLRDVTCSHDGIEACALCRPIGADGPWRGCDDHRPDGPTPLPDCPCAEIDRLVTTVERRKAGGSGRMGWGLLMKTRIEIKEARCVEMGTHDPKTNTVNEETFLEVKFLFTHQATTSVRGGHALVPMPYGQIDYELVQRTINGEVKRLHREAERDAAAKDLVGKRWEL